MREFPPASYGSLRSEPEVMLKTLKYFPSSSDNQNWQVKHRVTSMKTDEEIVMDVKFTSHRIHHLDHFRVCNSADFSTFTR